MQAFEALKSEHGPKFCTFVRNLKGKTRALNFPEVPTVDIKQAIEASEGIPVQKQRLTSGGRCLNGSGSLASYFDEGIYLFNIDLSLRLCGC